jgi:CheY-like chemotaxis protein
MEEKEKSQFGRKQTGTDLRVLYVEDKCVNQKILRIMLENIGCIVDTACNGKEGVDKVERNIYDIVFMDIHMPEMDGLTASSKILDFQNPPPVVAVTANHELLETLELHKYGIKDYLPKPVRAEELYEKLLYWVNKAS